MRRIKQMPLYSKLNIFLVGGQGILTWHISYRTRELQLLKFDRRNGLFLLPSHLGAGLYFRVPMVNSSKPVITKGLPSLWDEVGSSPSPGRVS